MLPPLAMATRLLVAALLVVTAPLAVAQPTEAAVVLARSGAPMAWNVDAATAWPDDPLEMGGLEGTPLPPSRDVAAAKKRQATARETRTLSTPGERVPGAPPITGFLSSGATLMPVQIGTRPYDSRTITDKAGFGVRDATGVRMYTFPRETKQWDHPVGQAQYALYNLNSYRLTQDQAYLDLATRNAQRLVDRKVESGGAWYYPYDFDFAVHGDTTDTLKAPWYSGMAQGQSLSVFVRLYQVTGDERWKVAADATYASLRQPPEGEAPFASWVDDRGRLWLELYPRYPVANSERVLNGLIYALFGLHDYWSLTQATEVRDLILGALRTVELSAMSEFRRPGSASAYSLRHALPTYTYHRIHVRQFLLLWRLTASRVFHVQSANAYRTDYPNHAENRTAVITPRVTTMYKADANGKILATKPVSFARATGAPIDHRIRLLGGPVGLRLSAGPHIGWYVPEGFGVAFAKGAIDAHGYLPKVTIQFSPRTFTAYRLDAAGNVLGHISIAIVRSSNASSDASAFVQGRPAWYIPSGAFAGHWVPMQTGITPLR